MKVKQKYSLIWPTKSLSVVGMILNETTVIAQRTDPPQEAKAGDDALKALRAELYEAGRVWVKKYNEATSEAERADRPRRSHQKQRAAR